MVAPTEPNEPIEELLAFYALGVLTPDEERRVEAHLRANSQVRPLVAEWQAAAAQLALASPPEAPSPAVKGRLMAA
ncbi:MAG: zf-HC2 domain-containing protein, partial [Candidatus Promineifilaceae bacterium]